VGVCHRQCADNTFPGADWQCEEQMIGLEADTAFHAAEGDPTNLKLCQRARGRTVARETVLLPC